MGTTIFRLFQRGIVPKGTQAYTMRHWGITEAIRGGANLFAVKNAAGHASISTTEIYLQELGDDIDFTLQEIESVKESTER